MSQIVHRAPRRAGTRTRGTEQVARRIKSRSSPNVWQFGQEYRYLVIQASSARPCFGGDDQKKKKTPNDKAA